MQNMPWNPFVRKLWYKAANIKIVRALYIQENKNKRHVQTHMIAIKILPLRKIADKNMRLQ